jgi:AraC-like DNA-binding protein
VVEVLKLHLASAPAAAHGWIMALRDPVLVPALASIHSAPDRKWSVARLAREAAVSVPLLDERFREVLGLAPIRYLAGWYDSEEAFSRAFKRAHGRAPSNWRSQQA